MHDSIDVSPLTDLEVEEYLVGDLHGEELEKVEKELARNERLRDYVAQRRAERDAFFVQHPRLPRPSTEAAATTTRRLLWTLLVPGALAAAALLLVLSPPGQQALDPALPVRAMGAFKVALVIKRGDGAFAWREGVALRAGDQVRITVETPQGGHLALIGRDGKGSVAVYYDDVPVEPGTTTLEGALVLDDTPGAEEWFFFLADQRVDVGAIRERLAHRGPLPQSAVVLVLTKEDPF